MCPPGWLHTHDNAASPQADPCLKNLRLNSALHYAYEKENKDIIHTLLLVTKIELTADTCLAIYLFISPVAVTYPRVHQGGATGVFHDANELGLIPAHLVCCVSASH